MKLDIPIIKQEGGDDCGITCLRMVLKYYGHDIPASDIKMFVIGDSIGTFETEEGRFAKHLGLEADCFGYNLYLLSPQDTKLSLFELLKKLDEERQHPWFDCWYDKMYQSITKSLREGVNYCIQPPTPEIIKSYLKRKIPLIVSVNPLVFNQQQGGDPSVGHDIVLSGIKGDSVYYIDPLIGKQRSAGLEHVMLSIYARKWITTSAWIVAIYPEKNKEKDCEQLFTKKLLSDLD